MVCYHQFQLVQLCCIGRFRNNRIALDLQGLKLLLRGLISLTSGVRSKISQSIFYKSTNIIQFTEFQSPCPRSSVTVSITSFSVKTLPLTPGFAFFQIGTKSRHLKPQLMQDKNWQNKRILIFAKYLWNRTNLELSNNKHLESITTG